MFIDCKICGDLTMCSCWNETKNCLPLLGEIVEGIGPREWLYSKLGRDYFALVEINNVLTWITPSLCDIDYSDLKITHWRHIQPDHKGKKPYVKIRKYKSYWEPKLYFQKEE
jgi:hypothetical protein